MSPDIKEARKSWRKMSIVFDSKNFLKEDYSNLAQKVKEKSS